MLWCDGGPSQLRRVPDPPPVEISVQGGMYVLDDRDEDRANWRYVFLAEGQI